MKLAYLGLVAMLTACSLTQAASPDERVEVFAMLPDWHGIWETDWTYFETIHPAGGRTDGNHIQTLMQRLPLLGHPPYNTEWEERHQARSRDPAAMFAEAAGAKDCSTGGFPMAMSGPQLFQIFVTPEETLFLFDTGETRHVYTDGRDHPGPEDSWPTRMGDSTGHWLRESLLIDTIARTPGPIFAGLVADLSEEAHFTEVMRMLDVDTLESVMTIDDVQRFTRPWQLTLRYHRVKTMDRLIQWNCENDRNPVVDGKLTIAPP